MNRDVKKVELARTIRYVTVSTLLISTGAVAIAQEDWRFQSAIHLAKGNYSNSQLLDNQHSTGVRISMDSANVGGTLGVQSTHVNMQPVTNQPQQKQDAWLTSAYLQQPSEHLLGSITYKLDTHHLRTDPQQKVDILAQAVSWSSSQHPFTMGINVALSNYSDMPRVKQYGSVFTWGFNHQQDWLELRTYRIQNLSPAKSENRSVTDGQEIRFTHFISAPKIGQPHRITLGIETGEKIYHVDMVSQSVYNLPMLNHGGKTVTAMWSLTPQTQFTLQLSQHKYYSSLNGQAHDFTLTTISAQTSVTW